MAKMEYLSKWLLWTSKLEKFTQKNAYDPAFVLCKYYIA